MTRSSNSCGKWRDAIMAFKRQPVGGTLRRSTSLLLIVCLLIALVPLSAATAANTTPSDVTDSSTKSFVKLSSDVNIFTTDTTPTIGYTTVASGTVLMLVSTDTYTIDSTEYGCLYYNNARYNVLWSDVSSDIMTATAVVSYITGTLWTATTYVSLKSTLNLLGNVSVYGLQYALRTLGYYSSTLDGEYGTYTTAAVKAFQKAYGLEVDGYAGPITQKVLYPLALAAYDGSSSSSTTTTAGTLTTNVNLNLRKSYTTSSARLDVVPKSTSLTYTTTHTTNGVIWYYVTYNSTSGWLMGTYITITGTSSGGTSVGTLTTTVNLNLRKSYSTKSVRLAVVPKSTTLSYSKTTSSSGVTWYYVTYNSISGWLMGTYVSASGSSSSGSSTSTGIGTVTATSNVVVRKTAGGSRTGYLLSKGSTATLLSTPVISGGYTWYYIKLSNGVVGYVRADYSSVSYDASTGVTPSTTKSYVQLSSDVTLFTSEEQSSTGAVTISSGTVLQMVSTETYTINSVVYCSLYYNNSKYNCVYADVSGDIMTSSELTAYITDTLWPQGYIKTLKESLDLTGDIYVHSLQYALTILGYYTGALDGNFGSGTTTGVRNFQRNYDLTVDGSCGPETSAVLYVKALAALTGTGNSDTSDFGSIIDITMTAWDFDNAGADIFPKSSTATVMDVETQMVFTIKRWSGAYHADCVPLTAADTKTMCDIVGFEYNSSHPTSSQITLIKNTTSNPFYGWPDWYGHLTTIAKSVGNEWLRRPALLNVDGHVYCVSIYGVPHGYGDYSTCDAYAASNNYYGMMCVHFVNSETHVAGEVDSDHQASIKEAYAFAKTKWPALCK